MINEINGNDEFKWSEAFKIGWRGEEPKDIKTMCKQLCKDYLGGVWHNIPKEKINIRRITGGFSNQLYYCGVSPDVKPVSDEPTEVAIRLYVKKNLSMSEYCGNERLNDTIVGMILSEKNLGPKIYGLFGNGEIIKYYKNHQFRLDHQNDPELVRELAQKLAKLHSLKVPIKKSKTIFDILHELCTNAYKMFPISQLIDEFNCETLKCINLLQEIEWLKGLIKDTNSPIVFTHFDFRGCNILVIDSDANDYDSQSRIVFCDYEYAGYYNRGWDISSLFLEWGRTLDDWLNIKAFPEPSMITPFINAYIEESLSIYGKQYLNDKYNTIEHIIYESNVFILVQCLYIPLALMQMEEQSVQTNVFSTKKQQMKLADEKIKLYLLLKNQLRVQKF